MATPTIAAYSRQAILYSVEQSLQRLQTDYIDLYYTHYWDGRVPLEETLRALESLVQSGKVRYVGCSNWFAWQVMHALGLQVLRAWAPFVAVQWQYSLLERSIEHEGLPMAQHAGLGLVAWSPGAGGFLSGKYTPGGTLNAKTRLGQDAYYRKLALNEHGWQILAVVREIAGQHGVPPLHVALAWVLHQPLVSAVAMGVSQISQIDENLAAANLTLSAEDLAQLELASARPPQYPATVQPD
ncbi:MAG: aldo/keto reductase [Anaerolineae bacterium]|nr:aldo/keto reductase [Anaerolineae bacterium]